MRGVASPLFEVGGGGSSNPPPPLSLPMYFGVAIQAELQCCVIFPLHFNKMFILLLIKVSMKQLNLNCCTVAFALSNVWGRYQNKL